MTRPHARSSIGTRNRAEHPMTPRNGHPDPIFQPETPAAARVDRLLALVASDAAAPRGLSQRVFEASRGHLAPRRLIFRAAERSMHRRLARTGRLALAAGIGLAFVVGLVAVDRSGSRPTDRFDVVAIPESASDDFDLALAETRDLFEFSSYSFDDLSYQLAALERSDLFSQ